MTPGATTCSLCGLAAAGEMVSPGPDWAAVHRACFLAFDHQAEAEELEQVVLAHTLPLPVAPARRRRSSTIEVAA